MADIGIGADLGGIAEGAVGQDRGGGAQDRNAGRRNGAKSTLATPKTKDTETKPDAPAQAAAPEDAGARLTKKLRRGRRASILASADNTGLGTTSVVRPGGRRASTLLG